MKIRASILAISCLSVFTYGSYVAADSLDIKSHPVHLHPDKPSVDRVGELLYRGGLRLTSVDRRFGGLSGLTFVPPNRLIAVSDRGWWITFTTIEKDGRLVGVGNAMIDPLRDPSGKALWSQGEGDAEAVEMTSDGALLVAFERRHRLWKYPAPPAHPKAAAMQLAMKGAWSTLPINSGFEAIAALADGRLLLVAEHLSSGTMEHPGWLSSGGNQHTLSYSGNGYFAPADFAPLDGGDVLALERRFTTIGGFASRLRVIRGSTIRPGARLVGREIARLERPLLIENFEGLAVRGRTEGRTLIYLVSDNNYNFLQRTLLLAFEISAS